MKPGKPCPFDSFVRLPSGLAVAGALGVAWLVVAGTVAGQTPAPIGVAKPAEYDCAGLEGPPLTSCRALNAAAISGAMVRSGSAPNATHDCDGMSGAALATCLDLNRRLPVDEPATTAGGGSGTALSNGPGVGKPASGSGVGPTPLP